MNRFARLFLLVPVLAAGAAIAATPDPLPDAAMDRCSRGHAEGMESDLSVGDEVGMPSAHAVIADLQKPVEAATGTTFEAIV